MMRENYYRDSLHTTYQIVLFILFFSLTTSCLKENKSSQTIDSKITNFHADNDIAMAIRSVIDAINVGEELNAEDYNYEGILTDGQGRPLYTDIHGNPGEWVIDVTSPKSLTLQNIEYGDLLPNELESYIIEALKDYEPQKTALDDYWDDDETYMHQYESEKFYINFVVRLESPQNGIESVLLNIVINSK